MPEIFSDNWIKDTFLLSFKDQQHSFRSPENKKSPLLCEQMELISLVCKLWRGETIDLVSVMRQIDKQ